MTVVSIRRAEKADAEVFLRLVRALAAYEGAESYVLTSESIVARDGFDGDSLFGAFLAEADGVAVGFASFTVNYSIWYGKAYLNVDDVYVDDASRGRGIGGLLMKAVAGECLRQDYAYARWLVEVENTRAADFYRSLGASVKNKGVCTWMPGEMT